MYYCLNVASHLPGEAGGVLIRALDPIDGLETMADLRSLPHNAKPKLLTGGARAVSARRSTSPAKTPTTST
jgi:DNA-3-methyladenine glycosylase